VSGSDLDEACEFGIDLLADEELELRPAFTDCGGDDLGEPHPTYSRSSQLVMISLR
jgi:hypothetical protein